MKTAPRGSCPRGPSGRRRDRRTAVQGEGRRERPRRDRRARDRDPMAVIEPQATPLTSEAAASPLLRGQDGDVSHAPAFLGRKSTRAEAPAVEAAPSRAVAGGRRRDPRQAQAPPRPAQLRRHGRAGSRKRRKPLHPSPDLQSSLDIVGG